MGKVLLIGCAVIGLVVCGHTTIAQNIDIPLFFDESDLTDTSTKTTVQTQSEPTSQPKTDIPNIGRKAIPINKLNIVPPPLPPVTVDLSDIEIPESEEEEEVGEKTPVNTRQEKISLPGVPVLPVSNVQKSQPEPETNEGIPTHDARGFDIDGIDLGMNINDAIQNLVKKGYIPQKQKKAFPLYRTTHYDTVCRQMGYRLPNEIRQCMRQLGENEKTTYVSEVVLNKPQAHESFTLRATSRDNDNLVWQIVYQNFGDNSLNFNRQNTAKKMARKDAFFNAVFEKYGYPDDDKNLIWGDKQDAYMQVYMGGSNYDATITLTDLELSDDEYFAGTEWRTEQPPEHFGFED